MDTVRGIFTFITRLTGLCLHSLHQRFVAWTTPNTTSLLLGTLTDLSRSKSELVAENDLLRQQLIILLYWLLRISVRKNCAMEDALTSFFAPVILLTVNDTVAHCAVGCS